jgi:flagellin-specific chaperone FliS
MIQTYRAYIRKLTDTRNDFEEVVLKTDHLAALESSGREKDELVEDCFCLKVSERDKQIAALESAVMEKNQFIQALKDALEQSAPNLILKEQIAALTAERDRMREAVSKSIPLLVDLREMLVDAKGNVIADNLKIIYSHIVFKLQAALRKEAKDA